MIDEPTQQPEEGALRGFGRRVLAGLVRRGEDFDQPGDLAAGLRETDRLREVRRDDDRSRRHA